tara:strand:- start:202 stop:603 length:402 start_codon:yes stop_codon:yes gene_type:complete
MSTHSIALQQTVFNTLDGDSTLQSLVSDVFNFVPQNTAYPYVQIGDDSLSDNSTKDLDGNIHSIVIHTWSRYRGDKEAKEIMARVYDLLHNSSLSVSGASLVNARFDTSDILTDPDGITKHGVQRFNFVIYDT